MEAFRPDGTVIDVVVTGEREIIWIATGKRFAENYFNLSDEDMRAFDDVCDMLYDMPQYRSGKIYTKYGPFVAIAAAHPANGVPYFCDHRGHKFLECPENEGFVGCPECGDTLIYPDTEEGAAESVRVQLESEAKISLWMDDSEN